MLEEKMENVLVHSNNVLQNIVDKHMMDYQEDALALIATLHHAQVLIQLNDIHEEYNPDEDFKWFTSGEVDTTTFKGKYIAIWKKQIVGSGDSAVEAERLAKAYNGERCTPAIVYVPEKEDTIL